MAENNLIIFKNRRKAIKSHMTRLQNYLESVKAEESLDENIVNELRLRFEKFEPCFEEFNSAQASIEVLDNLEIEDREREHFEDKYFSLSSEIKTLLRAHEPSLQIEADRVSVVSSHHSNLSNNVNSLVKLPPIRLPTFDGKYCNWLEFKDSFTALVDKNETLTDIQKFLYLKSSLEKDAVQIIKSFDISARNYQTAWEFLVTRFENKRLIIYNHIRGIMEHPPVMKESHVELRNLVDDVQKHLRSLNALGEKTDTWDRLIIYVMTNKFDPVTRRDWESKQYSSELPTMSDLISFLNLKCEMLEKLEISRFERNSEKQKCNTNYQSTQFHKKRSSNSFASTNADKRYSCPYCNIEHSIFKCELFLKLSVQKRIDAAKKLKLCLNCLRSGHFSWSCKFQKCIKCHKAHNNLLHVDLESDNCNVTKRLENDDHGGITNPPAAFTSKNSNLAMTGPDLSLTSSSVNETTPYGVACYSKRQSQVLLSTAVVKIKNFQNKDVLCRVLLDSGSQSNFITEGACKKLGLPLSKVNHFVKGVGQTVTNIKNQGKVLIKSCYNNFMLDINCLVIQRITERLPMVTFDKNVVNIPANLQLADPNFNVSSDIDILLGASVFWSILCLGQERLGADSPILQNTQFGWVLAGNLHLPSNQPNVSGTYLNLNRSESSLEQSIMKFWQIEEVNNSNPILSNAEKYCEKHFEETTERNYCGRFVVDIPFKESLAKIGSSRETALRRFNALERKFAKNPQLKTDYSAFMSEYESLGHMIKINKSMLNQSDGYFLPHHAVIKNSLTTKCRVVFDASAKTSSGLSLNDVQYVGPRLQQDIFHILTRFRKHNIVVTADILKMYRQILVNENQAKYQRIFWRSEPTEDVKCYELKTVTYGTASAPYLAVRCLIQLARENNVAFPVESRIIRNDFYMDDLLTGADSVEEALRIQRNLLNILQGAGFQLRKWLSNNKKVLENVTINSDVAVSVLKIGEDNKTLGVYWNSDNDTIRYSLDNFYHIAKFTKRNVLSIICKVFDPLGLLGPIIIIAKLIMQELWRLKLEWDDPLPRETYLKWSLFLEELPIINQVEIPRHVFISEYIYIELHGFSDASERAYGACLYVRCITSNGKIGSNLLCAKSRVAPLKQVSLPRLELCGALLLANLSKSALYSLEVKFNKKYYWSDSLITLAWIRGEPVRWKTFVANRVSEIQSLTDINEWNYVRSCENPADLLSRGLSPKYIENSKLWWYGPEFLLTENCNLESTKYSTDIIDIPEQKTVINTAATFDTDNILDKIMSKFSDLTKIIHILAFVIRFIKNARVHREYRAYGHLTPIELNDALSTFIRYVQEQCFPQEYECLLKGHKLSNKSKILSLNPFFHDGLIRVGGRIKNSEQSVDKIHPIILPNDHILTNMIIIQEHKRLLHAGTQMLLTSIRERYWPISGRNVCKKIVRKCIRCFKARPNSPEYLMGDLPEIRVKKYLPFTNVGTDFGGPILLKSKKGRGAKFSKAYICLFVCMSTKAVHIELVSDLTTEAFMATLRRFISRRGKPATIYSDNALNYVGAKNELAKVYEFLKYNNEFFGSNLANDNIKWCFIPARSPHFGGIWEAGIKSVKHHIKRVIGAQALTFEDFNTLLNEIEAILNSRPLCPLTTDPDDLAALTPAHFLIGRTLTALPEKNLLGVPENRLNSWQLIQSLLQHYWKRWNKEYLAELQTRTKWKKNAANGIKVGSLVLIKEDHTSPLDWQLGRVSNLHPGQDGIIRVVDIKVRSGVITRAVNRICILPMDA